MPGCQVWFWKALYPLLRRLAKRTRTPVNRLVNLAVEQFLGVCGEEELKVWSEVGRLCREDSELRRVSCTMLRSGSYLPQYADKLFRPPWDADRDKTSPFNYPRKGDVPLKALNLKEEEIMRRVLARREAIAAEIAELLDKVLPDEKFRLKPRKSRSRARDRNKSVNDVRSGRGDGL